MKNIKLENKVIMGAIITLLFVAVTYFYTPPQALTKWDRYSEVLPIGKMVQMQSDSITPGNFMGIYTEEWGDEHNYTVYFDSSNEIDVEYKSYTDQIGLNGFVFGIINKILYNLHIESHVRLQIIYFINILFACLMITVLMYGIYYRFGRGACIGAIVILLPFPVLFRAVHNLYWCLGAKIFPTAVSTLIVIRCSEKRQWKKSYYFYIMGAMLLCLCNTFEFVSMEMVMCMIPLLLFWIDDPQKKKFIQLLISSIMCIISFIISIFIWFIQCLFYYGTVSETLNHLWNMIGSRGGFNAISGDPLSELGKSLSALDVVSAFLYGDKSYVAGPIKVIYIVVPVLVILLICCFIEVQHHEFAIDCSMGVFLLVSFFSSISWMIISRGHAYWHVHLSILLWFFCFIPALGCWAGSNVEICWRIFEKK